MAVTCTTGFPRGAFKSWPRRLGSSLELFIGFPVLASFLFHPSSASALCPFLACLLPSFLLILHCSVAASLFDKQPDVWVLLQFCSPVVPLSQSLSLLSCHFSPLLLPVTAQPAPLKVCKKRLLKASLIMPTAASPGKWCILTE